MQLHSCFLFCINHLYAVPSCKQLELLHSYCFLSSEIPLHQVLELAFLKLETTSFNQILEVINLNLLSFRMLYSVEKSLKKHVVLLLISEFHCAFGIKRTHQLAEFLLSDIHAICSISFKVSHQRLIETLLSSFIIFIKNWTLEQIFHKGCNINYGDIIVSSKME